MAKVIKKFDIDLSNMRAATNTRNFSVIGDKGAIFSLEVKNEDGYYYDFTSRVFASTKKRLKNRIIKSESFNGSIVFPAITDNDQYDIYLFAESMHDTVHAEYVESRFGDGTLDINSSQGSNSNLLQKVIYQYTDTTITIAGTSPSGTQHSTGNFVGATFATDTITLGRGATVGKVPFSMTVTLAATKAMTILRQPSEGDLAAYATLTIGSGVAIDGDDIFDGTARNTDTVNGAVSESTDITMDSAVATKMKVGDKVTGTGIPTGSVVTVFSIVSTNVFRASEALDSVGDGVTLTFTPPRYRRWSVDSSSSIHKLGVGMQLLDSDNVIGAAHISPFEDTTTYTTEINNPDGSMEEVTNTAVNISIPALETLGQKPTIVNGITTQQKGNFTLNTKVHGDLAGQDSVFYAYGPSAIKKIHNSDLVISDLKVELVPQTTTTTSAVSASATIPVADREGTIQNLSTVSGIGINPAVASPTVTSATADGAGNWTLSAAQTLEDGVTLTLGNTSRSATITGNIEFKNLDDTNFNLYIDVEKFLSAS